MNLPNLLTALRIALIPVLVIAFYLPFSWTPMACAAIFALAALTDWADGYLARRLAQVSSFGAFLDPVADKLMVAITLVLLVQGDPRAWVAIPAAIIIGREIVVSALRELMAELGERTTVAVASIGKVKTAVQMVALLLMLYRQDYGAVPIYEIGIVLLYVAVGLTLWSMFAYLQAAWSVIRDKKIADSDSKDPDTGLDG
ncbi:MAG: CDP-diacylglycerol--glycerol-3-phosphate 3-phosphatidyltransferase [Ectothiorhodospiraceae bacterium AqS1]|nr:CDP-diacylglycerol--glycerol-3-phosphate 3-phosphatidyltransferase [Ectothiorhodospiraceae bacterium AqS1]